jgi:hypothetical protein
MSGTRRRTLNLPQDLRDLLAEHRDKKGLDDFRNDDVKFEAWVAATWGLDPGGREIEMIGYIEAVAYTAGVTKLCAVLCLSTWLYQRGDE